MACFLILFFIIIKSVISSNGKKANIFLKLSQNEAGTLKLSEIIVSPRMGL